MRYSDKEKANVVAFVKKYNEENGRGGQTAAQKKFKISPISIASWLAAAGEELPGKGGRKKSAAKSKKGKGGRPKGSGKAKAKGGRKKASGASASLTEKLQRLAAIDSEMQALQAEFDKLKESL